MKSARLVLPLGHQDANAVKFIRYLYLAAEPAVILNIESKIKNIPFQFVRLAAKTLPFFRNINMAGSAGTQTTTVTFNAWHHVINCPLHESLAIRDFHLMLGTIDFYVTDFWHGLQLFNQFPGFRDYVHHLITVVGNRNQ